MEAQSSIPEQSVNLNQGNDLFNGMENLSADISEPEEAEVDIPEPEKEIEETPLKQEKEESKETTIEDYIFQKLESFGWPGRLLQDYKDKFVSRAISADGVEEVEIEILDKQYPNMSKIQTQDIKQILSDIQGKFGLYFQGGNNNDGKWSFKFVSQKENPDEEENKTDMDITSYLDKAYGTPSNPSKTPSEPKKASTINEMIKFNKNELFDVLSNKIAKNYINKIYK
ncbi:MAG: hypothetical protein R6T91_04740 [Bacteroidales bacterium]